MTTLRKARAHRFDLIIPSASSSALSSSMRPPPPASRLPSFEQYSLQALSTSAKVWASASSDSRSAFRLTSSMSCEGLSLCAKRKSAKGERGRAKGRNERLCSGDREGACRDGAGPASHHEGRVGDVFEGGSADRIGSEGQTRQRKNGVFTHWSSLQTVSM